MLPSLVPLPGLPHRVPTIFWPFGSEVLHGFHPVIGYVAVALTYSARPCGVANSG
jgi:hypothetical protein